MLTIDDLLKYYQTQDWERLIALVPGDHQDLALNILATAVIGRRHPQVDTAERYGLSYWTLRVSRASVWQHYHASQDADLTDFARAYYFARDVLQDPAVAAAIVAHVQRHKYYFGQHELDVIAVSDTMYAEINAAFGNLEISRAEYEAQAKLQQAHYRDAVLAHWRAVASIEERLAIVLGIPARLFTVSFDPPEHDGDQSPTLIHAPEIIFAETITNDALSGYAHQLANLSINATVYDLRDLEGSNGGRGIQLLGDTVCAIASKLGATFSSSSVTTIAYVTETPPSSSFPANIKPR